MDINNDEYPYELIELNYKKDNDLKDAIRNISSKAVKAAKAGKVFIILSV